MSGLARVLTKMGFRVQGSEREASSATHALQAAGIEVSFAQDAGRVPESCAMMVISAAVKGDHAEVRAAAGRGVPVLFYAEALGLCMRSATGAAIAGTHGKSTTTSMLGAALVDAGLDPSIIVGATCAQLSRGSLGATPSDEATGYRVGASHVPAGPLSGLPGVLVAEACEYNRSFHHLRPRVACITNVEADHLDVYGTLDAVIESFRVFAGLLPSAQEGGRLLIAHEGAHRREITAGLSCGVSTIGYSPEADYVVAFDPATREVRVTHEGRVLARWRNTLAGGHNAMNASCALVLGTWLGAEASVLARSLAAFRGADRRMQLVGVMKTSDGGEARIFDDYGHHPTEVETTLRAMRESERPEARGGRLICVFQPHQHSRTRHLLDQFTTAFSQADVVIVPPIYFVRDTEEDRASVSSADLVSRLEAQGVKARALSTFAEIEGLLRREAQAGDVVVAMGAGDVWRVAYALAGRA